MSRTLDYLTGDPTADELLASDPNALLLGMVLDQQVTMEKAFAGPAVLAERLGGAGPSLARQALEGLAAEAFRAGRLSRPELRRLLGFETRFEVDGFLKERGINDGMTPEEFAREREDLDRLGL